MFNHLIYHQQPHHAISRPIALQMHQEWEKRQNEDIHTLDVAGRLKSTLTSFDDNIRLLLEFLR